MNLAIGIVCLWLGSCLIWVAGHGLPAGVNGFGGIWQTILGGITGESDVEGKALS